MFDQLQAHPGEYIGRGPPLVQHPNIADINESHRNANLMVVCGVPVSVTARFLSRAAAEGNPTKACPTTHDSHRLARPGMVLDSCKKVGAPQARAAKIGGALVKPPIASAASGLRALKSRLDARY